MRSIPELSLYNRSNSVKKCEFHSSGLSLIPQTGQISGTWLREILFGFDLLWMSVIEKKTQIYKLIITE